MKAEVVDTGKVLGLISLWDDVRKGAAEIDDVIRYIESDEMLKAEFAKYIADRAYDEVMNFKITDCVDGYNYFVAYKERIDKVVNDFVEHMDFKATQR